MDVRDGRESCGEMYLYDLSRVVVWVVRVFVLCGATRLYVRMVGCRRSQAPRCWLGG